MGLKAPEHQQAIQGSTSSDEYDDQKQSRFSWRNKMPSTLYNPTKRPYYWWRDLLGTVLAGIAIFGLGWYLDAPSHLGRWVARHDSYDVVKLFYQPAGWQIVFGVSLLVIWLFSFRARYAERRLHAITKEHNQLQEEFSELDNRYQELNRANRELRRRTLVKKLSKEEDIAESELYRDGLKEVSPESITELLAGAIAMKQTQIPDGAVCDSKAAQTVFFKYLAFLIDQIPAMLEEEDGDGLQNLIENIQDSANIVGVKAIAEKAVDVRKTLTGLHSKEIKKAQADLDALISLCRKSVASPQK